MIDPNMTKVQLYNLIIASLISADNDNLTENEKQEMIKRYQERPGNIEYMLDAIQDKQKMSKYMDLFSELTKEGPEDPLNLFEHIEYNFE